MSVIPKILMSKSIKRIGIPHVIAKYSIPHEYADISY